MSTETESPSPAKAEADAEQARAGLVSTLNQLRENLKPANVVDEVMSNAKVSASAITDQVWDTARKNPLPALMIGAGLAMIFGLGARSTASRMGSNSPPVPTNDRGIDPALRAHIARPPSPRGSGSSSIGTRASQTVSSITQQASGLLDTANQQLAGAASRGARTVNQAFGTMKGQDTMSSFSRSRDQFSNSVTRLLEEQPLILAAVGVALGAAIGAAIPQTERENSLMGETSHSVRDAATSMAQDQYSQLKSAAGHAVEDLKQTAADHGVNTENLSGLVRDVHDKTKAAAYEAGRAVNPET